MKRPAFVDVVASLFAATATKAGLSILCQPLFLLVCYAQPENRWNIAVSGSYTTTVRFLSVDGVRDKLFGLNYGESIDVRWTPGSLMMFGIAADRVALRAEYPYVIPHGGGVLTIPAEEGYEFSSIAASAYFILPFSTDLVQVYLGGGAGIYRGSRLHSIAGEQQAAVNTPVSGGIHAQAGVDVAIWRSISLRAEMKFRDPQLECENAFADGSIDYQGERIPVSTAPEKTTVNLNGLMYGFGICVSL